MTALRHIHASIVDGHHRIRESHQINLYLLCSLQVLDTSVTVVMEFVDARHIQIAVGQQEILRSILHRQVFFYLVKIQLILLGFHVPTLLALLLEDDGLHQQPIIVFGFRQRHRLLAVHHERLFVTVGLHVLYQRGTAKAQRKQYTAAALDIEVLRLEPLHFIVGCDVEGVHLYVG